MNWVVLTSLNTIYLNGEVKAKKALNDDPHIQHLVEQTGELLKFTGLYKKGLGFDEYYERYHKDNYEKYTQVLERHQLNKPQLRCEENDILILMDIEDIVKAIKDGDPQNLIGQIESKPLIKTAQQLLG